MMVGMAKDEQERGKVRRFFKRLNHAVTEVGIEHFDDDRDWDERVKLPEWQLARLRARHAEQTKKKRLAPAPEEEQKR